MRRRTAPLVSDAVLERLRHLHPRVIDLSLDRVRRLLRRLGDPQDRLPPVIHVAGTNGKGSTIAILRAVLEAAGLSVHVHTSPHLVRFSERFVVAGAEIADGDLAALLEECEAANGDEPITFFEITAAAGLLAFARAPADVTLLETGLGGRLDATNVVARPALTAITPISLDHQAFLGDTLAAIAGEKAGILKFGVACVVAEQDPEAAQVLRSRAAAVGVPLAWQGEDWSVRTAENEMVYESGPRRVGLPLPALPGAHQVVNAGVAVACADRLSGFRIGDSALREGVATAAWPGRLHHLQSGRLTDRLPTGWELWLDGGHNPAAGKALAAHAVGWQDRPLYLVFGMLRNKDAAGFLAPLAHVAARTIAVPVPGESAALEADEAAAAAAAAGHRATSAADLASALTALGTASEGPARVLITGSLYLAGAVLAENGVEDT